MIHIDKVPALSYDVAQIGSCQLTETVGPACIALGAVIGVFVNTNIH